MKRFRIIVALMGALMFYPASLENTEARPQNIPVRVKSGNHGTRSVGPDVKCTLCQKYVVVYVDKYFGDIDILVYNTDGDVVTNKSIFVEGEGENIIDFSDAKSGMYSIVIQFGQISYCGEFEL